MTPDLSACCVHPNEVHDEAGCEIGDCPCNPTYTGNAARPDPIGPEQRIAHIMDQLGIPLDASADVYTAVIQTVAYMGGARHNHTRFSNERGDWSPCPEACPLYGPPIQADPVVVRMTPEQRRINDAENSIQVFRS